MSMGTAGADIISAIIGAGGALGSGLLAPHPNSFAGSGADPRTGLAEEQNSIKGMLQGIQGDRDMQLNYLNNLGVPGSPTFTGGVMPMPVGIMEGNSDPNPFSITKSQPKSTAGPAAPPIRLDPGAGTPPADNGTGKNPGDPTSRQLSSGVNRAPLTGGAPLPSDASDAIAALKALGAQFGG